jgi:hypothetical protein
MDWLSEHIQIIESCKVCLVLGSSAFPKLRKDLGNVPHTTGDLNNTHQRSLTASSWEVLLSLPERILMLHVRTGNGFVKRRGLFVYVPAFFPV